MLVNNNFGKRATVNLKLDPSITALYEVSRENGGYIPLEIADNSLELQLAAGDGVLLALPEGLDFYKPATGQPDAQVNLAADALITCSQSLGASGCYMMYLNDGKRFSDSNTVGWRSVDSNSPSVVLDLGRTMRFNRVDLYPEGTLFTYGDSFPEDFTVSVSHDGEHYTQVAAITGADAGKAASVRLPESSEARYIRIDITKCRGSYAGFAEIEVYQDNGSLPAPEVFNPLDDGKICDYKPGEDLAFKKDVYPSSTTPGAEYRAWGWAADFINNGVNGQGWTSDVKRNSSPDSTEYMIIDLGDVFAVDRVVVQTMGCFPEDYRIELSTNGRDWVTLASETGAPSRPDGTELSYTPQDGLPIIGRFLRFIGTRLRGTAADGYMLQLGNISAYGTPICDTTALTEAMEAYRATGGDTSVKEYAACEAALKMEYLTQSRANACAKALRALFVTEEETTTADSETATEPVIETESVTVTDAVPESSGSVTEADTTATGAATTAAASGGKGCASVLPAASLVLLTGLCALPLLRKKRRS